MSALCWMSDYHPVPYVCGPWRPSQESKKRSLRYPNVSEHLRSNSWRQGWQSVSSVWDSLKSCHEYMFLYPFHWDEYVNQFPVLGLIIANADCEDLFLCKALKEMFLFLMGGKDWLPWCEGVQSHLWESTTAYFINLLTLLGHECVHGSKLSVECDDS